MTTELISKAQLFSMRAHRNQKRKYTGDPYWLHTHEVAMTLLLDHQPETVVAAGYLHDTVEDTDVTPMEIDSEFGPEVARIVAEVTDVSRPQDGNRAKRKSMDLLHLAASSPEGASVKLADLISNARDIVANDPNFARVYLVEKAALLEVLRHGSPRLHDRAVQLLVDNMEKLRLDQSV